MSRDRRGNGVQVVAGSNPACPTKPNHSRSISYRIILTHTASVASLTPRLIHAYSQRFGIRFLSDLLASDDGEFRWSPVRKGAGHSSCCHRSCARGEQDFDGARRECPVAVLWVRSSEA